MDATQVKKKKKFMKKLRSGKREVIIIGDSNLWTYDLYYIPKSK